jgi:hypothetical protein
MFSAQNSHPSSWFVYSPAREEHVAVDIGTTKTNQLTNQTRREKINQLRSTVFSLNKSQAIHRSLRALSSGEKRSSTSI